MEAASGCLVIDGVDIAEIGLYDLRSRISIIPQDPVLFQGTLRSNIDPFRQKSDEELWDILEQVEMKPVVEALPDKLQHQVAVDGANFSMGQRQLICLARAMVRRNKLVVMDEATASLDFETDAMIHKLIRKVFADCTIITIAHRLSTILDSDRILVFSNGQIAEFDKPSVLLQNKEGLLTKLLNDTHEVHSRSLTRESTA